MPETYRTTMTLKQAAQTALDIQNAINLSGVVHTFNDVLKNALWPLATENGGGTNWVNHHPICTLFLSKLEDLNGYRTGTDGLSEAYAEVKKLAEAE